MIELRSGKLSVDCSATKRRSGRPVPSLWLRRTSIELTFSSSFFIPFYRTLLGLRNAHVARRLAQFTDFMDFNSPGELQ